MTYILLSDIFMCVGVFHSLQYIFKWFFTFKFATSTLGKFRFVLFEA